jgi:hypothetical protein
MDAWVLQDDARHDPSEAFAFARGEPFELASGGVSATVGLVRPLDFAAVTDHSEFLGHTEICTVPGYDGYDAPACAFYRNEAQNPLLRFGVLTAAATSTSVCGEGLADCELEQKSVWQRARDAAAEANDDSAACSFTSFIAYEWTSTPGGDTMHRNVIFANELAPDEPISSFDAVTPEELWSALQAQCLSTDTGCDAIAIPHNPNMSNGLTFEVEPSMSADYAETRSALEPLVEMVQHKGESECDSGLSGDPLCAFEKLEAPACNGANGPDCVPVCAPGESGADCQEPANFIRNALGAGLTVHEAVGANPFRFGLIGSTDTHASTAGATEEDTWRGHAPIVDLDPQDRLAGPTLSPGGLAVVWAEKNSRSSIFSALRRRETYATSGTRPVVRFFGGFSYPTDACSDPSLVELGYEGGVPMGGVLPDSSGSEPPRFIAWAQRDPGAPGLRDPAPLERLQVVKVWVRNGEYQEKVIDVAGGGAPVTVDPATCDRSGAGYDSLCAVWTDDDFDPGEHALYYLRVVEAPSCRWSRRDCNALDPASQPAICSDPGAVDVVNERAWSSPIWFTPT